MKHAPGPWLVKKHRRSYAIQSASTNTTKALTVDCRPVDLANAKLMAAAPALVELCKEILPLLDKTTNSELVKRLKIALSDASY
jgi:hypothetical protein